MQNVTIPLHLAERLVAHLGESDLGREVAERVAKEHLDKLDGKLAQAVVIHRGKKKQVCVYVQGHDISENAARSAITRGLGLAVVGTWPMTREWWTGAGDQVKAAKKTTAGAYPVTTILLEAW